MSKRPDLMRAPASEPFLLRLGLVSVFVSAVRVPGAPLEEAVRERQNTRWATSFPVFPLATQAPGVENNPHSQKPGSAAAGLEKLVLEGKEEGRGLPRPQGRVWEPFSPAMWPSASQGSHLEVLSLGFRLWPRPPESGPAAGSHRSREPQGRGWGRRGEEGSRLRVL